MTTTVQPVRALARPPKRKDVVAWLEANWRAAAAATAGCVPGGAVKPIHRGLLTKTGIPFSFLNMAFVDATVRRPDRAIAAAESFYAGTPFLLVTPADHVDLAVACANAGLVLAEDAPGMALSPVPVTTVHPWLTIEPVTHELRDAFVHVLCDGFGVEREVGERMVTHDYVESPAMHDVVAFAGGEPVAIASSFESMGVCGVFNVATLPEHRGNGYGEAVTWAMIEGGRQRGCHTAVLQSTEMGFPVYKKMGFEIVSRYHCYTNAPG